MQASIAFDTYSMSDDSVVPDNLSQLSDSSQLSGGGGTLGAAEPLSNAHETTRTLPKTSGDHESFEGLEFDEKKDFKFHPLSEDPGAAYVSTCGKSPTHLEVNGVRFSCIEQAFQAYKYLYVTSEKAKKDEEHLQRWRNDLFSNVAQFMETHTPFDPTRQCYDRKSILEKGNSSTFDKACLSFDSIKWEKDKYDIMTSLVQERLRRDERYKQIVLDVVRRSGVFFNLDQSSDAFGGSFTENGFRGENWLGEIMTQNVPLELRTLPQK